MGPPRPRGYGPGGDRFTPRTASASATFGKRDLVQYAVKLSPNLVSLGGCDVTKCAFRLWLRGGGQSLWLEVMEIEVSPPAGVGIPLGILDSHIRAVEFPWEIAPSGRLRL